MQVRRRTIYVWHHQHLRLGQSLLEVVEVDCAVEGEEAHFGTGIPRQPKAHNSPLSEMLKMENPKKNIPENIVTAFYVIYVCFTAIIKQVNSKTSCTYSFLCWWSRVLTYPGSPKVIHRSTSGNLLQQRCKTHQAQTGRQPAVEVATEHTRERQKNVIIGDLMIWSSVTKSWLCVKKTCTIIGLI